MKALLELSVALPNSRVAPQGALIQHSQLFFGTIIFGADDCVFKPAF